MHGTLNEHLRLLTVDRNKEGLDDKLHKIIRIYNDTIHSTTQLKPIEFITKNLDRKNINDLKEKFEIEKVKRTEKLNKNRNPIPKITENIVQDRQIQKISPKYKRLKEYSKQNNYVVDRTNKRNTKYYKTQQKRKYKYQVHSIIR